MIMTLLLKILRMETVLINVQQIKYYAISFQSMDNLRVLSTDKM